MNDKAYNPSGQNWTVGIEARLIELVQTGKSSGQIADLLIAEFGKKFTRNSVGGKVFRMRQLPEYSTLRLTFQYGKSGLEWAGRNITKETRAEASRKRWQRWEANQSSTSLDAIRAARAAATKRRNAERRAAMKTQTSEHAVHFLDRTSCQCCWPLWADGAPFSELMCCGAKAEAVGPYCPAHAYRASNVVKGEFVRQPGYFKSWVNTGRAA